MSPGVCGDPGGEGAEQPALIFWRRCRTKPDRQTAGAATVPVLRRHRPGDRCGPLLSARSVTAGSPEPVAAFVEEHGVAAPGNQRRRGQAARRRRRPVRRADLADLAAAQ
ncbi:hypothetical protein HBB16_19100 [Pseudonocardia sp. MCCB 268]|nr:hypothetical protein [Pseudonocardia cytotoxica]